MVYPNFHVLLVKNIVTYNWILNALNQLLISSIQKRIGIWLDKSGQNSIFATLLMVVMDADWVSY